MLTINMPPHTFSCFVVYWHALLVACPKASASIGDYHPKWFASHHKVQHLYHCCQIGTLILHIGTFTLSVSWNVWSMHLTISTTVPHGVSDILDNPIVICWSYHSSLMKFTTIVKVSKIYAAHPQVKRNRNNCTHIEDV